MGGLDDIQKELPEGWDEMVDGIAERNKGSKPKFFDGEDVADGLIEEGSMRSTVERIDLR